MLYIHLIKDNAASMKRALLRAIIVSSGQLARGFFSFLIAVILARIAGTETFGEYTLFITVFIIASEIPNALDITFIKHANELKSKRDDGVYLLQGFVTKCAYALIVSVTAWGILPLAVYLDFISSEKIEHILLLAIIAGASFSIYSTFLASFQQRHDFLRLSMLRPILHGLVLGVFVYYFAKGIAPTITDVIIVFFYISITLSLIGAYVIVSNNKRYFKFLKFGYKNFIRIGSILTISAAITQVSNRLDVFFITNYLDFNELGLYGVALRISIIVFMMTGMLSTILIPKAPEVFEDKNKLKRYMALSGFYIVLQVLMGMVIIIFMEDVIKVFFGKEYIAASMISSILVCQGIINSMLIPFQSLIQVGNKPSLMLYLSLIRMLLGIAVLSQVIPAYGLYGASIGVLGVSAVMVIMTVALFYYFHHKSPVVRIS